MPPVPYIQFGKYLLLDRIAVGGMAEVYRAKFFGAERFEKILAIKKLLPNIAEDEEFVEMFINEAKLASQLTHSNICQIYDLGKIDGNLFIAMEYVWGKDLLQIINWFRRSKEAMPPPMAAYIATRICEGIDYAYHKRGPKGMPLKIIHRDVSPQNVLISYDGEVKIIDFGIAKATLHHSETQAGLLKGKFSYMSPEQVQGYPIDHRSDIFSIGTCLFEMLTSMSLFRGENDFVTLEKVRKAEVPRPTEINPKIPKSLEKILLKALAPRADDRWQRAADFQDALQRFLITTPPIYTAKRLADWMKITFTDDIEKDKQKMEEYTKLGPEVLRRSLPPSKPPLPLKSRSRKQPKVTMLGVGPPPLPTGAKPPVQPPPVTIPRATFNGAQKGGGAPPPQPQKLSALTPSPATQKPRESPASQPFIPPVPAEEKSLPPQEAADDIIPIQNSSQPQQMSPDPQKEELKIVAIPKTDGKGITTTGVKVSDVDFEEDEEPTRALDDEAQALLEIADDNPPPSDEKPSPQQPPVVGSGLPQPQQMQPGMMPQALHSAAGAYPPGTVAIGPDGKPILIPYPPRPTSGLSSAMKWVLVFSFVFVLFVIGGVVVFLLLKQTRETSGTTPEGIKLAENEGAVLLRVVPSSANIKINGRLIPDDEKSKPIVVPAKVPIEVEVWQEGYKKEKFPLLVPPKNTITKEIALQELKGRVIVNSVPDKAEVYVGGQLKGETPATLDDFPINNRVTVSVKKEGYEIWSEVVELNEQITERTLVAVLQKIGKRKPTADSSKQLTSSLSTPQKKQQVSKAKKKTKATASRTKKTTKVSTGSGGPKGDFIALTKPRARVYINGKDTGRETPILPTNPIKLSPGAYRVTFKLIPSGETKDFRIKVKPGEQVKIIKNFEK